MYSIDLKKNFKSVYISLLLILFLSTGFNNYHGALDKVGFQWLYLSLLNIIFLVSFFIFRLDFSYLKHIFYSNIVKTFSVFILWACLSIFYAFNKTEAVLILSRFFICFFSIINISLLLCNLKYDFKLLSYVILIVLIGELYFSFSTLTQILYLTDYDFSYSNLLKGVTGNKNITSSVLAIKLPFILYLLNVNSNKALRFLYFLVYTLVLFTLFALSSRAVLISLFLVSFSTILFFIIYKSRPLFVPIKRIVFFHFASLIISFSAFQSFMPSNSEASVLNRITTINTEDTSASQRLRYYGHAINFFKQNPIIGVGLGNWKIKSIDLDKDNINGYTVPYHVHNDFLELATELGIIGLLSYLSIFIFSFFSLVKSLKKLDARTKIFSIILCLCGIIYFIDANLNFPYARVINQVMFIIILSFIILLEMKTKKIMQ